MKAGIIHDNYAFCLKTRYQCELAPIVKYITIDVLAKVIKGKQHFFMQSTNNVSTFFCLPVVAIDTGFTYYCITARPNDLTLKATRVYVDNSKALSDEIVKLF